MALSRIGSSADLANLFARSSIAACSNPRHSNPKLHASVIRQYPEAPHLPLPSNVSEIFNIETSRFAPERARDIAAPLFYFNGNSSVDKVPAFSTAFNQIKMTQMDSRVDSYDCFGAVSLSSSMQTNVPKPFCSSGLYNAANLLNQSNVIATRFYSTTATSAAGSNSKPDDKTEIATRLARQQLTKKERLKIIIRDYGRTVIFFHVGISLISLGIFYSLVSSGLDLTPAIQFVTGETAESADENSAVKKIMSEGSTFLIAYAVHKLFAPFRISLTLGFTPILVQYLRRKGILKRPKIPMTNPPR